MLTDGVSIEVSWVICEASWVNGVVPNDESSGGDASSAGINGDVGDFTPKNRILLLDDISNVGLKTALCRGLVVGDVFLLNLDAIRD